jgi:TPR repeat protein
LPSISTGKRYNVCCGKTICCGCIHAGALVGHDELCPFCRTPAPSSDEEIVERDTKRMEMGDAQAIRNIGDYYYYGDRGLPQGTAKALELWHRAGELGCAAAYNNIGFAYDNGEGVERDEKKAMQYYELAAMGGAAIARHNLGHLEKEAGNMNRALKHYMIAVGFGYDDSLKMIQRMYKDGHATKDDYAKALLAYQAYLSDIKSDQRDKVAALSDRFKYY